MDVTKIIDIAADSLSKDFHKCFNNWIEARYNDKQLTTRENLYSTIIHKEQWDVINNYYPEIRDEVKQIADAAIEKDAAYFRIIKF